MSFSYTETHVCEGRDAAKLWSLASVAVGLAIGAVAGGALGQLYGLSAVRQACEGPGATNLCGLSSAPFVPVYTTIGALVGATAAAFAVFLILRMRKA
jgi:putative exporter of polyketide antibiotics